MTTTRQSTESREIAARAGLRYATDEDDGIRRRRCGRGFTYIDRAGRTVKSRAVRERISALAIPPAWEDVWINPDPRGHIQCTGRDDRGRKQYLYHPRWNEARERAKFARLVPFGEALPALRARVDADLRRHGMPREKVLATVIRLLETTGLRIGNAEYETNGSYGLTTLRRRHVDIGASDVRFHFVGKGGREIDVTVHDRRLAELVRRCDEVRGWELFRYLDDDGEPRTIDSTDVNEYIGDAMGGPFTAKDFRTWLASLEALRALLETTDERDEAEPDVDAEVREALDHVAERLHNSRNVCRDSYVHPEVTEAHCRGRLREIADKVPPDPKAALSESERALLAVLRG